jgi:hypothetical protein
MAKNIDVVPGAKIGHFTIVSATIVGKNNRSGRGHSTAWCRCACGVERSVPVAALGRSVKSCGSCPLGVSHRSMARDLTGARYGRLVVLAMTGTSGKPPRAMFRVRCDCGSEILASSDRLTSKRWPIRSCGCVTERRKGSSTDRDLWRGMHKRCSSAADAKYYAAKGIVVCDRWSGPDGFSNFMADMGARPSPIHTVDRIKNDLGYSPDNCRWATNLQQQRNRTNNKLTEAKAAEIRARHMRGDDSSAMAIEYGVSCTTIWMVARGRLWASESAGKATGP